MFPKSVIIMQQEDMGGIKRILDAHKLEGWKWLASYTFLVAKTIVLVCQTKFLIEEWENFSIFSSAAAMYFIPILGIVKLYSFIIYSKKIHTMYVNVDEKFWDKANVKPELQATIQRRLKLIDYMMLNHTCMALIMCLIFVIFPLARYPDHRKTLPCTIWLPFDSNPSPTYQILYFILGVSNHVTIMCNVNYDLIYVYFSQHLSVQFVILKEMLRNINLVEDVHDGDKYTSRKYQEVINERMKMCVNHHRRLISFFNDIQSIFSICLGVQLALSILSLVFFGYILQVEEDVVLKLKFFMCLVAFSVQFTMYAVHGSELEHQSESVAVAVYECEWYYGSKTFIQGLMMILINSGRPLIVSALGMVVINNTTIVMLYRTVFSILTLIKELVE